MSENKEETNQTPTPDKLAAATRLISEVNRSDYWTDELREELDAAAALHSLQVEAVGGIYYPDSRRYVRAPSTAVSPEHLLEVPESTFISPNLDGYDRTPHFLFFGLREKGLLETKDELHSLYVKDGRVRDNAIAEIILRRDALYKTLIFNSDAIRDVLSHLQSILAVPLVVLESADQDWILDMMHVWLRIIICDEDQYHCLLRISKWLTDIDIPPVLKQGVLEGALYWLRLRDKILLGVSIEDDNPILFKWDDPGPRSALVRYQIFWVLDALVLTAITDGKVQTNLDENLVSLSPFQDKDGEGKLTRALKARTVEQYYMILKEADPRRSIGETLELTCVWLRGQGVQRGERTLMRWRDGK